MENTLQCADFSLFEEMLKNMRRMDDLIINTLNTVIPTDSFHPDGKAACLDLKKQLDDSYTKREDALKHCITVTTNDVRKLKASRENDSNNLQLLKQLKAEQTKLKMLRVELGAEELIKERTTKVFNERCRKYLSGISLP
ncbi:coiled-coil domain-containing protein 58 [Agrilus planipennis]|uniref:Protein MIX23 n=1 Tax=Agrilus planipennis TaxID=224129 RepID=A0A1W4WVH4_AGRPL|nr:coiled-coil domain-containing protein 58 [Agrilus planipennis]